VVQGPVTRHRYLTILGILGSLLTVPAFAQQTNAPDTQKNPFSGDPAAIAAGKTLYEQTCQNCHGGEARGDRGPALNSGNFRHGSEDSDLFRTIRAGIPGTQMPSFALLPADNVWRLITYIRSLNTNAAVANEVVTGDAAAGEATFWGKGNCGTCHEVNARGLSVGPDLSDAGKNSAAYLRSVILDPDAAKPMLRRFFGPTAVTVKTRNNGAISGMKVAEDNYTLLMTDLTGKLRRFNRDSILTETVATKSLMPGNYGQLLSPAETQDLIAYLKSLKARDLTKTTQVDIPGGLSFARLRNADAEPQNWLTYWGDYQGHHFSSLRQITPLNVKSLQAQWSVQMPPGPQLEATPLVVDGILYTTYTTTTSGGVYAIDARSGLQIWKYDRHQETVNPNQINPFNRGVAILGNRVFFGTLDAALVALDARTGRVLWETKVADTMAGNSLTGAPLALNNKIVVGIAGGEFGIRGFLDAYDPATGKRLWRFNTIPGPGEVGHDSWSGESWLHGSGAAWLTGSYDAEANVLYWTVGNPGPNLNGQVREGDNLFTCSVVALDPETGQRQWHYQFTPGDTHDWDANEDVVLADTVVAGVKRRQLLQADRNGMFYALDRTNGKLMFARPYVQQTWNRGFDPDGRPIFAPDWKSSPAGTIVAPLLVGGANWQNPSYDPIHSVEYVVGVNGSMGYRSLPAQYEAGRQYQAGTPLPGGGFGKMGLMAIDTRTGAVKWDYPTYRFSLGAGALATGGGLVFLATGDGNLIALNATTGKALWHFQTGGTIASSPISYAVEGKQFVSISAGNTLYSFALPD
jgi:PQQ-dependent dehydrogenase (methanol/ethanol family)